MKSIKILMLTLALGANTVTLPGIIPTWMHNKTAYKIGAAVGAMYLLSQVANFCVDMSYGPLLDNPLPAYKQQPQTIAELQELLQMGAQEDCALMAGNMQDWYLAAHLNTMSTTELRNQSRVGSITLATATKNKQKNKKRTFTITWSSLPGLSEQQVQELNKLQYRYVKEFSRAICPAKKSYEIDTRVSKKSPLQSLTNNLGRKTGMYYYAPTMIQKRKVQEMHMRNALSSAEAMMEILANASGEQGSEAPQQTK